MSLPPLIIIPAGAGSGKTHTIQQQLGDWVVAGQVAPERIVAVTFTETAAAELRERIRAKLLDEKRLEDALRLDQAYISTIHGFGLRILTEFAFDAGLSPQLRLLNEDEESTLIRLALARTDKADPIISDLSAFGYSYDYNSQKSAEDSFRDDLLTMVKLLRSVGWDVTRSDDYAAHARAWITHKYGFTEKADRLTRNLRASVETLLAAFPENLAPAYEGNNTASVALQRDYKNLTRALKPGILESEWPLWQALRNLRLSMRGSALPEGYDALAEAVIGAANALPNHPGPRDHAIQHIETLIAAGQDVLVHYAQAKQEAGLIDYNDMIAMALELLQNHPDVLAALVERVDCLVVDEFQDTNPLQFALLWKLKEAGVPTIVVGDLKQAIMGFQGADPRLFAALEEQFESVSDPLTRNWRSQPDLMAFINAVGPGLFGNTYVALAPQGGRSALSPVEVVEFQVKAKKGQKSVNAAFVGQRIQTLLGDDRQQINDRRTKQTRRLRGGDVAILCPTHNALAEYAAVLRGMGLRVRLQEDGWQASRVIQLALHALAYIANPADRHAALYLAVTELGQLSLKQALTQLMTDGVIRDPVLEKLDTLALDVADRTLYTVVADMCSALALYDQVSLWPDGEQARANLLRLQAEAGAFMDANREALASGGFHGTGIQTFLAWLSARIESEDKQPEPRVLDEDAIELVTWHSSKGREWPVVVVCGMDRKLAPKLPTLDLGYSDFEDLSRILNKALIEYSPKFAAPESDERFIEELASHIEVEAKRLLYVAITRPRDKLILEWPTYLDGKEALTYWSLLINSAQLSLNEGNLHVSTATFPCHVTQGDNELPDNVTQGVQSTVSVLTTVGRLAIEPQPHSCNLTPDSLSPSLLKETCEGVVSDKPAVESYSDGLTLTAGMASNELGTLIHRCFEVLGSQPGAAKKLPTLINKQLDEAVIIQITDTVEKFESWVNDYFKPKSIVRELPLMALNERGSLISGTADMVIETDEGLWVVDHKSDQQVDPIEGFSRYRQQLQAYVSALEAAGGRVCGMAIHWVRRGKVSLLRCAVFE